MFIEGNAAITSNTFFIWGGDIHYDQDPPFDLMTHNEKGVGGTENFGIHTALYLVRTGHDVRLYTRAVGMEQCAARTFQFIKMPPGRDAFPISLRRLNVGLFDPSEQTTLNF